MNDFEKARQEAAQSAEHTVEVLQESGQLSSLDHKFPYFCKTCRVEFYMNFHDIMKFTEQHMMPCGHPWGELDWRKSIQRMMDDK